MQKTIKILSFISLGMIVMSIIGLLVGYPFLPTLAELLYGQDVELSVPTSNAFSLLMQLVTAVLLVSFAGHQKFGIRLRL